MITIVALDSSMADGGELDWPGMQELGRFIRYDRTLAAEVLERSREADAIITNKVRFDRQLIAALPRLKYIGITATGTNNIELEAAAEAGVAVTNVPAYSTDAVAQLVFAFILEIHTRLADYRGLVASGAWSRSSDFSLPLFEMRELAGKKLGILGYGAIGKKVAEIARAFGMMVLVGAIPGREAQGRIPFSDMLRESDIVTLHCPLTDQTREIINEEAIRLMKPSAVLINTARGSLLNESAVADALQEKRLAYAAVDVLSAEPPARPQTSSLRHRIS